MKVDDILGVYLLLHTQNLDSCWRRIEKVSSLEFYWVSNHIFSCFPY